MDLLLGNFVRFYINDLDENELLDLSNLLEVDDEILLNFHQNDTLYRTLKKK